MTIVVPAGYVLPAGAMPLKHARIVHSLNWKTGGTISASTTATDYFAAAPNNSLTYEKWKPTGATATWEYNHGSATTVDTCCIAAHSLTGATIQVEYWTGSAWAVVGPSTVVPDNSPIMFLFAPVTAQRWRLNITAGGPDEIGVIRFAQALQMPRPEASGHTPVDYARQTEMRANRSETNEILGRTKQRTALGGQHSWDNLPEAWIRANWPTFQKAIETEPFFIAWRPSGSQMVAYGLVDSLPIPTESGVLNLYSVDLEFQGYAYD